MDYSGIPSDVIKLIDQQIRDIQSGDASPATLAFMIRKLQIDSRTRLLDIIIKGMKDTPPDKRSWDALLLKLDVLKMSAEQRASDMAKRMENLT